MTLTEKWADGASTLHGMHSRGFPNCFIISNTQSGFTVNFPHMLDEQAKHLAYILEHARRATASTVIEAVAGGRGRVGADDHRPGARSTEQFLESCTPGYYNNEGQPDDRERAADGSYGGGSIAFVKMLEAWRAAGDLEGLELTV